MRMFQLRPFIGQNGALASTGLTKHISMHPTITLCGRERSIFSEVAEQSFTFLRGGQKTEVCTSFMYSAAFSISGSEVFLNKYLLRPQSRSSTWSFSNKSSNRHSWWTQACNWCIVVSCEARRGMNWTWGCYDKWIKALCILRSVQVWLQQHYLILTQTKASAEGMNCAGVAKTNE